MCIIMSDKEKMFCQHFEEEESMKCILEWLLPRTGKAAEEPHRKSKSSSLWTADSFIDLITAMALLFSFA